MLAAYGTRHGSQINGPLPEPDACQPWKGDAEASIVPSLFCDVDCGYVGSIESLCLLLPWLISRCL